MKNLIRVIVIWKILVVILFAQNGKGANEFFKANNIEVKPLSDTAYIDPYSFFPSEVGNYWQYTGNYLRDYIIAKDSLLSDGSRYVYEEYWERPTYQIDTNYNVIFDPFYRIPETLYVLNAKQGERWWVWQRYEDTVLVSGYFAVVDTIYSGNYLGKDAIFKVIKYYYPRNDTLAILENWDKDVVLASGMGLVYEDMDAERPMVLISAIIDGDTLGTIVSVEDEPITTTPSDFTLSQNYPNPFNSETIITYEINEPGYYKIIIYNMLGETIEIVESKFYKNGKYQKNLSLSNFASGLYMCTLLSNRKHKTIKMLLLK